MFHNCIVKKPSPSLVFGITTANLGTPNYTLACKQHEDYIAALTACGATVSVLEPDEAYPDSCFVEDVAVLTKKFALITRPGAPSRKGEVDAIVPTIKRFYADEDIVTITSPGTLEGGDVMLVGDHFYIGISARTNREGAGQFIAALERYGYSGEMVPLNEILHLKTGLSYLENNNLLICGEFLTNPIFKKYNQIQIPAGEEYAANCIWVNGKVIVPVGYPKTKQAIQALGYDILEVDTSEYRKIDGGLSCLSLRF